MGALVLSELTRQLAAARALTDAEVRQAVAVLVDEAVPAEPKAEFLIQLARKGETVAEITAFARERRRTSRASAVISATVSPLPASWTRNSAFGAARTASSPSPATPCPTAAPLPAR